MYLINSSAVLFWVSFSVIVYTYLGYPFLLYIYGSLKKCRVNKETITPSVSLIIAAHNEEQNIAEKLQNSLELDYPSEALEIVVASDGSNDQTNDIVASYSGRGVKLLALPRRGKIFALHDAITESKQEILVFSDANTIYNKHALRNLIRNFADPEVGGVCGNQLHLKKDGKDNIAKGERLYWNYDKWLKRMETATGSIVSADGAIYAIRKALYRRPPSSATTDDFALSTGVVEQGFRLVFDSEALAFEEAVPRANEEFRRKVRIINRGLRGIIMRKKLLNPFRYGFYSVVLFSHKLIRRMVPIFLIVLFLSSIILSSTNNHYLLFTIAQAVFYSLAFISYFLRNTPVGQFKVFYIPFFYCLANIASLVAIWKLMSGERIELWQPQR